MDEHKKKKKDLTKILQIIALIVGILADMVALTTVAGKNSPASKRWRRRWVVHQLQSYNLPPCKSLFGR